jgi:hypothetical protein
MLMLLLSTGELTAPTNYPIMKLSLRLGLLLAMTVAAQGRMLRRDQLDFSKQVDPNMPMDPNMPDMPGMNHGGKEIDVTVSLLISFHVWAHV